MEFFKHISLAAKGLKGPLIFGNQIVPGVFFSDDAVDEAAVLDKSAEVVNSCSSVEGRGQPELQKMKK